ncbi:hypothetical protein [Methylorubrum zatmanii]|uniref:Uncharacterized protein n=1 Tax=Methylorubrum zatmanii TaxID=29429 RepID=A0ABW1WVB7_9HYPH|nr:hypothetical protein [Methylorubrum zatmanii]
MIVTETPARPLASEMRTGPSFAAALCGFLGCTVATTMVMLLLGSSV